MIRDSRNNLPKHHAVRFAKALAFQILGFTDGQGIVGKSADNGCKAVLRRFSRCMKTGLTFAPAKPFAFKPFKLPIFAVWKV